jgi:hypothetical protein
MNELRDQIKKITDKNNATTTEIAKLEEAFVQAKEEKVYVIIICYNMNDHVTWEN